MKIYNSCKFIYLVAVGLIFFSCSNDEDPISDTAVNQWITGVMEEIYLWEEDIPSDKNFSLDPISFFSSLRSSRDRFSVIWPSADELLGILEGVSEESGMQVALHSTHAQVLYVKPNSPASKVGVKRGNVITSINGVSVTPQNWHTLTRTAYTASITNYEGADPKETRSVNITPEVYAENPIFMDTVYSLSQGKVGYLIYHFFSPGPDNTTIYDDALDRVFEKFKTEGINELILDFRYNSGGSVASAINLASLIGPVSSNDIMSRYSYNSTYQNVLARQLGSEVLTDYFLTKEENINDQLLKKRVFVLTSSSTASASEMVINGLKPYMEVILVGDRTVGKNVGSTLVRDERRSDNPYGLLPIITRFENRDGESDFENGFAPDFQLVESSTGLLPFGDVNEPLLALALSIVQDIPLPTTMDHVNLRNGPVDTSIPQRPVLMLSR